MRELKIGGLNIPVPIVQGGMGVGISMSKLAVAVANQGGVGVNSSAGLGMVHRNPMLDYIEANIEGLRTEIRKAKEKTEGIIGVNVMVAMTNFADLVRTSISEKADIIFAGAGLPLQLPSFLKSDSITKLVPIVSSGRAAKLICDKWKSLYDYLPDAFVVEGPKAGGHLGFKRDHIDDPGYSLDHLVTEVIRDIRPFEEKYGKEIPVIAAGGIYTGEDVFKIMQKGAKAVQLGTRFVTTQECDASEKFKMSYVNARETDMEIIQSPVGMPGRAVMNEFLNKVKHGLKKPIKCPFHCIKTCDVSSSPYCIITALYNAYKGNMRSGYAFAGSNAYLADRISTVKEVFNDLMTGFNDAYSRFQSPLESGTEGTAAENSGKEKD